MHRTSWNAPAGIRTIAIVGGGFCGATVAANLLRLPPKVRTRIVLIERAGAPGRGFAYARRGHDYLLNVPADQMSADPDRPHEFLEFARRRLPFATADDFLPRALYGEYLEHRLAAARHDAATRDDAPAQLECLRDEAVGVVPVAGGARGHAGWRVELARGDCVLADEVVLALGNPPPRELPHAEALRWRVLDPWDESVTFRSDERVLVVGTGLTMLDFVQRVSTGRNPPRIHAISRHGWLPAAQSAFTRHGLTGDEPALRAAAARSAGALVREVRRAMRAAVAQGRDWREVVGFVRPLVPELWQALSPPDRARFTRHARAAWDIHRHRAPSAACERVAELRAIGVLKVEAARIERLESIGNGAKAWIRPRGAQVARPQAYDRVVNCTGPDYDAGRSRDPVLGSLSTRGLLAPEASGLRTGEAGAVLDRSGRCVPGLHYVGPMLRADHWEATAVPELRLRAQRLAQALSQGSSAEARFVTRIRDRVLAGAST